MSDAEPTMTTADVLAKAERIYREFGALMEWVRAASADNPAPAAVRVPEAPPVAPLDSGLPTDLIPAAAAAAIARRAKSTIGAWCRANAWDGVDGFEAWLAVVCVKVEAAAASRRRKRFKRLTQAIDAFRL